MTDHRRVVLWMEVALRDLERLAARLHEVAPLRAEKVLDRILSRGDSLATLSHRGRTPPELRPIADRTWLEVIESPWRIVYRVVENTVEIHAVLDGRRDLRDILLERMLD
ncbi:MAG: type II toxin-antitoxin system RelE/ParE family toxin [Deltaproteobacteria bacterium]|nr:MAG: type II toxin-antitoxin system RelE/ParE family toxin [Deltaproteobacteria bacterium]TMQ19929.1 MAG: type II toxin-antitoxin system RelE/ParE family toxin [Deltaproteobacteria bacterium]